MSSPAPFHPLPSDRRTDRSLSSPSLGAAETEAKGYELYNLGTELRHAAEWMKDYSYLVLRLPTEESWAFAQSDAANTEAPPPYPLWIPRREAVVTLARTLALEVQCVAEDTTAFNNWTSRYYPSLTLTLSSTRDGVDAKGQSWLGRSMSRVGTLVSSVRQKLAGGSSTCFVFQKIPGGFRRK